MKRRLIPDIVHDQQLTLVSPATSVMTAVERMIERDIGCVLVTTDGTGMGQLLGIFTERDLTMRIVGARRDPRRTRIGEVMTRGPDTLSPRSTARDALNFMQNRHYRHLPIVEDDRVVGMVSIRDLFAAVTQQLEEDVHSCEAFVFGAQYSVDRPVMEGPQTTAMAGA